MAVSAWSDSDLRAVHSRLLAGESWSQIGADYGLDDNGALQRWRRAQRAGRLDALGLTWAPSRRDKAGQEDTAVSGLLGAAGEPVRVEGTGDSVILESPRSARIRTLAELLAACEVDAEAWQVERYVVNKWEVGSRDPEGGIVVEPLFQVKAWLSRKAVDLAAVVADLKADMAVYAPRYAPIRYYTPPPGERHMLVISMADHHIGLLAWHEETGADYDSAIAEQLAADAMDDLLHKASVFPVDKIAVVIGNDWFHTDRTMDGKGGTTAAGTVQDVDSRHQKMFRAGRRVAVAMLDAARQMAPVTAVCVPGNHDAEKLFYLGDALQAWYRQDDAVSVVNNARPRHYLRYGATLLGMTHGHQAKPADLPLLMATEAPGDWAATEYREWLIGHFHAKRVTSDDTSGVQVHVVPSLCPPDSWHAGRGLLHRRSCEARLYHHDAGPAAVLTFNAARPDS